MATPTAEHERPRSRGIDRDVTRTRLEAGAITVTAFVVILATAPQSLWLDEAISVRISSLPFDSFLRFVVGGEPNMALFHVLLWPVAQFHPGDAALRVLPVAAGALALGATYLLGCRLFGRGTAALAIAFLAVHGYTTRYATEVRGYSLLVLLTVLCALLLVDIVRDDRPTSWMLYALCAVLAMATHFLALFTIAAQLVSLLVVRDRVDRRRLARLLIVLGAATTVLVVSSALSSQGGRVSWIPDLSVQQVTELGKAMTGGTELSLVIVGGFAIYGSARALLAVRTSPDTAWPDVLLVYATWLPLLAGIVVSIAQPLLLPRYFVAVLPPLALLLSRTVVAMPRRPILPVATAAIMLAVVLVGHPDLDHGAREGTKAATDYVVSRLRPRDAIFLPYNEELPAFQWYGHDRIPEGVTDARPGVPGDALTTDWWWEDNDRFGDELARRARTPEQEWRDALADNDRVWVLSGFLADNPRFYDTGTNVVPDDRVECDRQWFEGIDVVLWARSCD
jgi:uncharacterized membrane protein